MTQWLGLAIFIALAASLAIHTGLKLPWFLDWIGTLPGDLIIRKKGLVLYVPITSSLLISAALSFLSSLLSRK